MRVLEEDDIKRPGLAKHFILHSNMQKGGEFKFYSFGMSGSLKTLQ